MVRRGAHVVAIGAGAGGVIKLWQTDGTLVYEDCGYATCDGSRLALSQGPAEWTVSAEGTSIIVEVTSRFRQLPQARFSAWSFLAFRVFSLMIGRLATVGRWLKGVLVTRLIRSRSASAATLHRRIAIGEQGEVTVDDRVEGATNLVPLARQVPVHMGSSRYAHAGTWPAAAFACPSPVQEASDRWRRSVTVPSRNSL